MSVLSYFICALLMSMSLASPHISRRDHHRALALRGPSSDSHAFVALQNPKRRLRKRCKTRPGSSPTSTVVANVGVGPSTSVQDDQPKTTEHHDEPKSTKQPATTHNVTPTTKTTKESTPTATKASGGGGGPSFMTGTQTGQGTFYATGLGACGITNKDTDYIAAMSQHLFDNYPGYDGGNPNNNPLCGRKVKASYEGKSVTVIITDRCVGCALTDLDFSPSAFNQLADFDIGRISGMTWNWV